jgi:hypothetical protein
LVITSSLHVFFGSVQESVAAMDKAPLRTTIDRDLMDGLLQMRAKIRPLPPAAFSRQANFHTQFSREEKAQAHLATRLERVGQFSRTRLIPIQLKRLRPYNSTFDLVVMDCIVWVPRPNRNKLVSISRNTPMR